LETGSADTVRNTAALREEYRAAKRAASARLTADALPPTETAKLALLSAVSATPFLVAPGVKLDAHVEALRCASSVAEVNRAGLALMGALEMSHQQVFAGALSVACANAALKLGFTPIESVAAPSGIVRLVATDPTGRALVTEIGTADDGGTDIRTEVFGVADGTCNQLLDAFDKALEDEGVRADPPRRTITGGVCQLAATRDFVRRKVKPRGANAQASEREAAAPRRGRRLADTQTNKQR
jgi:hypothetical protein